MPKHAEQKFNANMPGTQMMKNLPTFCDDFDRNLALPATSLSERSVIHPLVYHNVSGYKYIYIYISHPLSEVSRTFEQTQILWEL